MAPSETEKDGTDAKIERQVGRKVANILLFLISFGIIIGWAATGIYRIMPGEAAVVLHLGRYEDTRSTPGLAWHLPPPIQYHRNVNVSEVRSVDFSSVFGGEGEGKDVENTIQTLDSNIVVVSYVVQYSIQNAFSFLYRMALPEHTLRDAAMAALREVIGQRKVDEVLYSQRAAIELEARDVLQKTLDEYFAANGGESAFRVRSFNTRNVQPPSQVQEAFLDVSAAQQDQERAVSLAGGDAREIVERASAEAAELREQAQAYHDAKILEAEGESKRFVSVLAAYRKSPRVTRRRLYLETMEDVMASADKFIVEPGAANLMPLFSVKDRKVAAPVGEVAP